MRPSFDCDRRTTVNRHPPSPLPRRSPERGGYFTGAEARSIDGSRWRNVDLGASRRSALVERAGRAGGAVERERRLLVLLDIGAVRAPAERAQAAHAAALDADQHPNVPRVPRDVVGAHARMVARSASWRYWPNRGIALPVRVGPGQGAADSLEQRRGLLGLGQTHLGAVAGSPMRAGRRRCGQAAGSPRGSGARAWPGGGAGCPRTRRARRPRARPRRAARSGARGGGGGRPPQRAPGPRRACRGRATVPASAPPPSRATRPSA